MVKILVEGAINQFNYMQKANDYMELHTEEHEKTFLDI